MVKGALATPPAEKEFPLKLHQQQKGANSFIPRGNQVGIGVLRRFRIARLGYLGRVEYEGTSKLEVAKLQPEISMLFLWEHDTVQLLARTPLHLCIGSKIKPGRVMLCFAVGQLVNLVYWSRLVSCAKRTFAWEGCTYTGDTRSQETSGFGFPQVERGTCF